MEFKFNFDVGEKTGCDKPAEVTPSAECIRRLESKTAKPDKSTVKHYNVADIIDRWSVKDSSDIYAIDEVGISNGQSSLYAITPSDPDSNMKILKNDLISSVYEGGFKIWECTLDLIEYLREYDDSKRIQGETVIDIGCGVGLLGAYALKFCQAAFVTFQDFNESVLLDATGPTALINSHPMPDKAKLLSDVQDNPIGNGEDRSAEVGAYMQNFIDVPKLAETVSSKMDFVTGDWSELARSDNENHTQYDLVLSSETIYNESNYDALHDYLNTVTKSDGVVLMSAKSHYFGVGGGVQSWVDFVTQKGVFTVDIVKDIDTNLKRHILRLIRK